MKIDNVYDVSVMMGTITFRLSPDYSSYDYVKICDDDISVKEIKKIN